MLRFWHFVYYTALTISMCIAQDSDSNDITELERYWSYGRSLSVYPSPIGLGTDEWGTFYARADALVKQMTNDEKNNITYGSMSITHGCSGMTGSVPRLGFPGICFQDSASGVHGTDMVNGYPSGIHVGAAWNRDLAYVRAQHIGAEFKAKGVSVALGPVAGPIGKVATGGRNWEGFSNDPYLSGQLTAATVRGMQESVIACIKHFIGNEQETNRNPPLLIAGMGNQSISANIDPNTLHELYSWPFQDAVHAGVGAVMCAYNRYNNSYSCQNSYTQNGLLKSELGFQGLIVSDWYAQHSGVASAEAGLDVAMPNSVFWQSGNLSLAVSNGSLAQSRLDDMATRIIAVWYRLDDIDNKAFSLPGFGLASTLKDAHKAVDARSPASKDVIFQSAVEGHVLVKNENVLPLTKPTFLSVFGYDAIAASMNTFPGGANNKWELGMMNTGVYENGSALTQENLLSFILSRSPASQRGPGVARNGTLYSGGGSGANTPSYVDSPFDALQRQAYIDNTFLAWDFFSGEPVVNGASEHCLVFINAQSSEGWDRSNLADQYSDHLVLNVAAQCKSTIVVLHNAGVRLVEEWVDHPNVTAVMFAHLPGQDSGRALVEILYGKQSPSGRMPYTVARKESDYGQLLHPVTPVGIEYYTQDYFTEGVYVDYKHFIARNITPRFDFGYGLTYTTFSYHDIEIEATNASHSHLPRNTPVKQGGQESIWDILAVVRCTIRNTGSVAASEVAQLYVNIPSGPEKVLRGLEKENIEPGVAVNYEFSLTRRDLSTWTSQGWVLQCGVYTIHVGKSVLDIQLMGKLHIP